ncbi:MAG: EscU/YscU/HrcU family type III secretion system export apparatus switch protein, partial [Planctomycetota bacterium]
MAEDLGERTEEATPRRRQEARDEGNVAKSQDFSAALLLLAASLGLWAAASMMLSHGATLLGQVLGGDFVSDPVTPQGLWPLVTYLGRWSVQVLAPLMLIVWVAGALTNVLQIGWLFAPKALQPKLSKLDPIKGAQRIFGLNGLVRATLDAGKVVIVVTVAVLTILQHEKRVVMLPQLTAMQCAVEVGRLMLDLALRVLAVLLLLGLLDLVYQRWKHSRDLKMTRQEVQDEMKQTEGDPHVKRRRMRMQQQIA